MEKSSIRHHCSLLIIGGSAGSLDVILMLLPSLRPGLSFPIIIVLHRKNSFDSTLTDLLASKTTLPVKEAEEKDILTPGIIYVAPADYHLLVEKDGTLSLDYSEKVNYSRPSIDVTFETAAEAFGPELVCLLLSGASADGTEGLKVVKKHDGIVIVQNPVTAKVAYMPQHAIADVVVDRIIDASEIDELVNTL
ncbi:chemotaxis protein CheB [Segetibacter koreensis]|uniref:chemotaxis protein CheB n=1 Tax=Segetibacter koreensis TaxID=398037 RepID=UPI0003816544|nr:chemotaxis protein CheB [Segetibacter koreensis]